MGVPWISALAAAEAGSCFLHSGSCPHDPDDGLRGTSQAPGSQSGGNQRLLKFSTSSTLKLSEGNV